MLPRDAECRAASNRPNCVVLHVEHLRVTNVSTCERLVRLFLSWVKETGEKCRALQRLVAF